MKSRLVAVAVLLGVFFCGYLAGSGEVHAQVSTMAFGWGAGDTVQLRLAGGGYHGCVVEGFSNGWVNCRDEEQPISFNLAQVISATVSARAPR